MRILKILGLSIGIATLLWTFTQTSNAIIRDDERIIRPIQIAPPTAPPPRLPLNPAGYPGIRNPNFKPQCRYTQGIYVCADQTADYCRQFFSEADCRYFAFHDDPKDFRHAIALVRTPLGGGYYLYCLIEPNYNFVVPNTCYVAGEYGFENQPNYVLRALCLHYRTSGAVCDNLIHVDGRWRIDEIPSETLHPCTGGTRCDFEGLTDECQIALSNGSPSGINCQALLQGYPSVPPVCRGQEAAARRFIILACGVPR